MEATMTVGHRWNNNAMYWNWINDHIAVILTAIAAPVGIYITTRYSLLGKILDQTNANRVAAENKSEEQQARLDKMEETVHTLRSEILTARGEVLLVRNENTELIRQNHVQALDLQAMQNKYDNLLVAHQTLQAEHDTLRRQVQLSHPEAGNSIG